MNDRKKILIVDDNTDNRFLMQLTLKDLGYEVELAQSVREGIDRIAANIPDLIVLDYMMPDALGSALAKYVRGNTSTAQIPIIMLTAYTPIPELQVSFGDVNEVVRKPVDLDEFEKLIQQLLESEK